MDKPKKIKLRYTGLIRPEVLQSDKRQLKKQGSIFKVQAMVGLAYDRGRRC